MSDGYPETKTPHDIAPEGSVPAPKKPQPQPTFQV
jgi:hypothetical protein